MDRKTLLKENPNKYDLTPEKIKKLKILDWRKLKKIDVPRTVAPCDVVRTLKSISAIELLKAFPQLKQFYARCGVL